MGRATVINKIIILINLISIHALRGEGDDSSSNSELFIYISIHALRGEGDDVYKLFQNESKISIHALRGEGDSSMS